MTDDLDQTLEIPTLQAHDPRPGVYYVTAADQITQEETGEVFMRTALLIGPFGTHKAAEAMVERFLLAQRRALNAADHAKFIDSGQISFGVTRLPDSVSWDQAPDGPLNARYGYVPIRDVHH